MTEKNNKGTGTGGKECVFHQGRMCSFHCGGYSEKELDYGLMDSAAKGHCVRLAVEGNAGRCLRLINDAATRDFIRQMVSQIRSQRSGDF